MSVVRYNPIITDETPFVGTSGIPPVPTPEEWKQRSTRIAELFKQWAAEEPSDDLATADELLEGLKQNPVQFREVNLDE